MFFQPKRNDYEFGMLAFPEIDGSGINTEPVKVPFDGTTPPIFDTTQILPVGTVINAPDPMPTVYTADQLGVKPTSPLPPLMTSYIPPPIYIDRGSANPVPPPEEEEYTIFGFTLKQIGIGAAVVGGVFLVATQKGK